MSAMNDVIMVFENGIFGVLSGREVQDKRAATLLNTLGMGKTLFTQSSIEKNLDYDLLAKYGRTPEMRKAAASAVVTAKNSKVTDEGFFMRDANTKISGYIKGDIVITSAIESEELSHCLFCIMASRFMHANLYPYYIYKDHIAPAPSNLKRPKIWYYEEDDSHKYTFTPSFTVSSDYPFKNGTSFDVIIDVKNFKQAEF